MSGVASGKLRHWVVLQSPGTTQDATTGEMIEHWATVAEVWAEVVPMSAREFQAAAAEQSEVRGRMTIRYRDDVGATMRVMYRGKVYEIHGVMEDADSMREHLTLMVGEGVRLDR